MKRIAGVTTMLVVLGVVLWIWAGAPGPWNAADPAATPRPSSDATASPPAVPERPGDAFALTVDYVYDGDTIRATVVEPNDVVTTTGPLRIRLIGIDTPEGTPTAECWADEARAHLAALLPEGSTVWATADSDSWDRYDRRLFYLWTGDGTFVNHALVASGDAEAIRVWPNVAFYDLLTAAQREAESAGLGRWSAC